MDGAVWLMAIAAIFSDRCMLPQQRTTLLLVTGVAGTVDSISDQRELRGRTVRIVAVSAGHAAEADRMRKRLLRIGALFQMTGIANLCLVLGPEHGLMGRMHRMTIRAVQIFHVMDAAGPVQADLFGVAGHALLIMFCGTGGAG